MPIAATIKAGLYKDSVALMRIGELALAQPDVERATLLMGTPANKEMLEAAGLRCPELDAARPNDLMIVVEARSIPALEGAQAAVARLLDGEQVRRDSPAMPGTMPPRSIAMSLRHGAGARIAQISVPGPYAGAEAMKALRSGLHVFLFSDNVPLAQERALKALAQRKNLLVMGPDCGTAIIGGVPLGFANVVRRGSVGLVGASGTGLQQVSCRIHDLGQGVSHVIGTGGRDVHAEIGGETMGQALDLLAGEPDTQVIGIVSKPPAPEVATAIIERAARAGKPCVVLFLGTDLSQRGLPPHVVPVATLDDAAAVAVALALGQRPEASPRHDDERALASAEAHCFAESQRHIRGLFSGGTFCTEARLIWQASGVHAQSNLPIDAGEITGESTAAVHCAIDFGAGEFTVGRPHPMIDMTTRVERILREARDASVAVVLLDIVLGYGSHPDPAGVLAPAVAAATALAAQADRHLAVVTFVCGTEEDPQRRSVQQRKLRDAGALVCASSTGAARLAGAIAIAAAERASGHRAIEHTG